MRFLHVRFCSVSVRKTELWLTCSVRFGQNGKTLLRSVTTMHPYFFWQFFGCLAIFWKIQLNEYETDQYFLQNFQFTTILIHSFCKICDHKIVLQECKSKQKQFQVHNSYSVSHIITYPSKELCSKMALEEGGVSLPWWCHTLVLQAPGYWGLFLNLIIFS